MNVSGIPAALAARDLSRAEAFYFEKLGLEAVESSFLNASDGPVGAVVGDTVNQIVLYPAEAKSSGFLRPFQVRLRPCREMEVAQVERHGSCSGT